MQKIMTIFVSLLVLISLTGTVGAQPKLTVPTNLFNFGYAPQNAKISHGFWLYSTGRDTVQITDVKTGCGCTKAPLERNILSPGDSTCLEIIFSTQRYQHEVSKTTRLLTNSGTPSIPVTIVSNVTDRPDSTYPVVITPYKLNISQFGEKVRNVMTFTIKNVSPQELKPTLVAAPDDIFEITLPEKIKPGATEEGVVKLKVAGVEQSFQKSFTLELDDPNHTRFTVPVIRNYREVTATQ
ncbi:MAG: DUF1573 domain-containing protein [Candidatus Zixiibacteriota bacterium]